MHKKTMKDKDKVSTGGDCYVCDGVYVSAVCVGYS